MNAKNIIRNLTVSTGAWLLFAFIYSITHEGISFPQTLANHLGLCIAIIVVFGAYTAVMKEKA